MSLAPIDYWMIRPRSIERSVPVKQAVTEGAEKPKTGTVRAVQMSVKKYRHFVAHGWLHRGDHRHRLIRVGGTEVPTCKSRLRGIKYISVICATAVLSGCTTLESIDLPPDQLQARIREGNLLQPGEIVSISTVDREYNDISIAAVTDKILSYEEVIQTKDNTADENTFEANQVAKSHTVVIPIDEIVKVTKKEPTAIGYAAGITAGAAIGWMVVALPLAIVTAMLAL